MLPVTPGFSRFISSRCEGQSTLGVLTEFNTEQMTYHGLLSAKIQIQQSQTLLLRAEPRCISCHSRGASSNSLTCCTTESIALKQPSPSEASSGCEQQKIPPPGKYTTGCSSPLDCWLQSSTHRCLWLLFCCMSPSSPGTPSLCPSRGLPPCSQGVSEVLRCRWVTAEQLLTRYLPKYLPSDQVDCKNLPLDTLLFSLFISNSFNKFSSCFLPNVR